MAAVDTMVVSDGAVHGARPPWWVMLRAADFAISTASASLLTTRNRTGPVPFRLRRCIDGSGSMLVAHRSRLELLARLGYAARGIVNLLIGLLALLAAFGRGGGTTGSKGALQTLLFQPLGSSSSRSWELGLFGLPSGAFSSRSWTPTGSAALRALWSSASGR